ncbi:hypothetical protein Mapa_007349 [Marchantia paleacea]|nr:hypothetical protein Mapa_007349 [Marchantia paleacea]
MQLMPRSRLSGEEEPVIPSWPDCCCCCPKMARLLLGVWGAISGVPNKLNWHYHFPLVCSLPKCHPETVVAWNSRVREQLLMQLLQVEWLRCCCCLFLESWQSQLQRFCEAAKASQLWRAERKHQSKCWEQNLCGCLLLAKAMRLRHKREQHPRQYRRCPAKV